MQRGNAVAIEKAVSGVAKIDPLIALLNAVALMSTNPAPVASLSIYDRPELLDALGVAAQSAIGLPSF